MSFAVVATLSLALFGGIAQGTYLPLVHRALEPRQAGAPADIPPACTSACNAVEQALSSSTCSIDITCICQKAVNTSIQSCYNCLLNLLSTPDPTLLNQGQQTLSQYEDACLAAGFPLPSLTLGTSASAPSTSAPSTSSAQSSSQSSQAQTASASPTLSASGSVAASSAGSSSSIATQSSTDFSLPPTVSHRTISDTQSAVNAPASVASVLRPLTASNALPGMTSPPTAPAQTSVTSHALTATPMASSLSFVFAFMSFLFFWGC